MIQDIQPVELTFLKWGVKMSTYEADKGGISSLMGFTFQIKVFVYYMLKLEDKMQIEFETIEDVNSKKTSEAQIERNSEKFISRLTGEKLNQAIQVKRTKINKENATQMLLNWLLLESSSHEVDRYILFTHDEYKNKDIIFKEPTEKLFKRIKASDPKSPSTMSKVSSLFDNFEDFMQKYNSIKCKYEFTSISDIERMIDESCESYFRKAAVNEIIYYRRIEELIRHVTVEIMGKIDKKEPYTIYYKDFMSIIEEITINISKDNFSPNYVDFKRMHKVDLEDHNIIALREYKQLATCELSPKMIIQNLMFNAYYQDLRHGFIERKMLSKIDVIEETTFENFENIKYKLKRSGTDDPYSRLEETKNSSNSYAENEQIRYGSAIYLTAEFVEERQISWKDESDEATEA